MLVAVVALVVVDEIVEIAKHEVVLLVIVAVAAPAAVAVAVVVAVTVL